MALPPLNTTRQAGPHPTSPLPLQSSYGGRVFALLGRDHLVTRLPQERLARLRAVLPSSRVPAGPIRHTPRIAAEHLAGGRPPIPPAMEVIPERQYTHVGNQRGQRDELQACGRDCYAWLNSANGLKTLWAVVCLIPGAVFLAASFAQGESSETSKALLGTGIGFLGLGGIPLIAMCHYHDDDE